VDIGKRHCYHMVYGDVMVECGRGRSRLWSVLHMMGWMMLSRSNMKC
jgi:hypothetical protein